VLDDYVLNRPPPLPGLACFVVVAGAAVVVAARLPADGATSSRSSTTLPVRDLVTHWSAITDDQSVLDG
jgi:hypothetical protein